MRYKPNSDLRAHRLLLDKKLVIHCRLCAFQTRKVQRKEQIKLVTTASKGSEGRLQVVFVTTEVAPWSKVGGLADVLAALPTALAARGLQVMTIAPLYADYADAVATGVSVPLHLPEHCYADSAENDEGNLERAYFHLCKKDGVDRVFVSHPLLYGSIYGENTTYLEASARSDLDLRYSVLCQAALAAPVLLWEATRKIVYVGNDWPTALLMLRLVYDIREGGPADLGVAGDVLDFTDALVLRQLLLRRIVSAACAFCIHNLAYQGKFSVEDFSRLCLPVRALSALDQSVPYQTVMARARQRAQHAGRQDLLVTSGGSSSCDIGSQFSQLYITPSMSTVSAGPPCHVFDEGGASTGSSGLNFMRAALLCSDLILTVSPNYAHEVKTDPHMGCGLVDIIEAKGVTGIMNGIDVIEWNPETDIFLPPEGRFSHQSVSTGKAYMKKVVQERFGLTVDPSAPLFGFVGRLTEQKGVDVLMAAAPALLCLEGPSTPKPVTVEEMTNLSLKYTGGLQLALLGTGEPWLESALSGLSQSFPGRAAGATTFSEELAHMIIAASDFILVPSRFEPCGLVAQCAVRYGAVPIVTAVGGLKDLVAGDVGYTIPSFSGNTESSIVHQDVVHLIKIINKAKEEWRSSSYLDKQQRCMHLDVSWLGPAANWEKALENLT